MWPIRWSKSCARIRASRSTSRISPSSAAAPNVRHEPAAGRNSGPESEVAEDMPIPDSSASSLDAGSAGDTGSPGNTGSSGNTGSAAGTATTGYRSPLLGLPGAVAADAPDQGVAAHYGNPHAEQRA